MIQSKIAKGLLLLGFDEIGVNEIKGETKMHTELFL